MMIRIPMLSEVKEVVRIADISLNSEMEVVKALNEEAGRQGKRHKVILMADLGDLREGYWDEKEIADAAEYIENKLMYVQLIGIGTNVGCNGAILPTRDKLEKLIDIAETIEKRLGRELEYISGGASTSLMRIWDGDMPERINMLRVGEGILLARDMDVYYKYDISELYRDVFRLKAEVIEVKDKPTRPIGTVGVDAFGHTPVFEDQGIRKSCLLYTSRCG